MISDSSASCRFNLTSMIALIVVGGLALGLTPMLLLAQREESRLNACQRNLKELVFACHGFHDVNQQLPPARRSLESLGPMLPVLAETDPKTSEAFGPGWLVMISPYLEEERIYDGFNVNPKGTKIQGVNPPYNSKQRREFIWNPEATMSDEPRGRLRGDPKNKLRDDMLIRSYESPVMLCPLYDPETPLFKGLGGSWGRGNYAINSGPCEMMVGAQASPCGPDGPPDEESAQGVSAVNWGMKLNVLVVKDGTSRTVLLAEVRAGIVAEDIRGVWAIGFPGASVLANTAVRGIGPNDDRPDTDIVTGCAESLKQAGSAEKLAALRMGCDATQEISAAANSRSNHPGGVNVAMCDAAVRFVSDTIEPRIWYRMLSAVDGKNVQLDDE